MDQLSRDMISDVYKEFRADSGLNMLKKGIDWLPLTVDKKIEYIERFRGTAINCMNYCFDMLIKEIKSESRQRLS